MKPTEDLPNVREEGLVESVDIMPWGVSIVIKVDDDFLSDISDDGLREATEDQIEEILS